MSYINYLVRKTFKRRMGKNIGTIVAITLGVSLMMGVQITITSFGSTATDFFLEALGENDIIITKIPLALNNYTDLFYEIENSGINVSAMNARVRQFTTVYNEEEGQIEQRVPLVGFDFNEDEVFGDLYDENGTIYTQGRLNLLLQDNSSVLISNRIINDIFSEETTQVVGKELLVVLPVINLSAISLEDLFYYKDYNLTIKGIVKNEGKGREGGNRNLWTNIDHLREITGLSELQCTEINIALSADHIENPISSEEAYAAEDILNELLAPIEPGVIIIAIRATALDASEDILNDVLVAFNLFGALIIFSGVLLIVNIQLIQVEDRLQQLGILRAIGSKRREIIKLFLMESTIAGVVGSIAGIGGGYGMSMFLVWQIGKTFFDVSIQLRPIVTIASVTYSLVVGLILSLTSGLLPALRASRVDVIEVIRGIKKIPTKRAGTFSLPLGLTLVVGGITTFVTQSIVQDSYFTSAGWDSSVEQWIFLGAAGAFLIGLSILLGYLFSKKILGNFLGLSLIGLTIVMLMATLPLLNDLAESSKILITLVVLLALSTILFVGVNLRAVTNFIRTIFYRTRLKKAVSLVASKYMTARTMRSTLTFGIFTLVLTMNIFASVYQQTFKVNTLDSVEFYSGGGAIYAQLDIPVSNISGIDVESELLQVNDSITQVQGIKSAIAFTSDLNPVGNESALMIPSGFDLVENDTFKDGDDYVFDFIFSNSIKQFNAEYKPDGSQEYQREYSHKIWDIFYSRDRVNREGYIDNDDGLLTIISTLPFITPGETIFISTLLGWQEFIVLALMLQYPFSLTSMLPKYIATPDVYNILPFSLIVPAPNQYLIKTSEDFREGRNHQIAQDIEYFFNANTSIIRQSGQRVAATAHSVWDVMLETVEFQVKTFDFMQYFVGFGLVVGAMGMIIIAVRNVSERRREIGMMRAIGYKKRQIIESIMLELFILAGLGLFMGLVNGIVLGWAFARLYDWSVVIPLTRILIYTGIMIGVALVASIIPGIRASRITPAEALRYVG